MDATDVVVADLPDPTRFYVVCEVGGRVRGWVVTPQEADAICERRPELYWDVRRVPPRGPPPLLTIDD